MDLNTLTIDSIQKKIGASSLLTDIFLQCKTGQIIGILGRNGSGKSTLLKIIFGAEKAQHSFVRVNEQVASSSSINTLNINYLPQKSFIPDHLKLATIITLFCNNIPGQIISTHPKIAPHLHKKPKQLSIGEKRFFEVLLIIYSNSKFSLLDEPFQGLSPLLKTEVSQLIINESKHKGFIITDHDYATILKMTTQIKLLIHGTLKDINGQDDLLGLGYISSNQVTSFE